MYFVRHSERLDQIDPETWKASKRFKENVFDTPLSDNGFRIAKHTIIDILKRDKREIGEIYSSPAQRCVQTAMVFQKQIEKIYGILVPINIENGLIFDFYNVENYIKKFEKNKVVFGQEVKKIIFVDNEMTPKNIGKRFGKIHFNSHYKPFIPIKKINAPNDPQKQFNMRLKTAFDLINRVDENKLNIAVTHQEIIADTIGQFCFKLKYNWEVDEFRRKYFASNDYCFWITVEMKKDKMKILSLKNKDGVKKITKKL